jgi:hypothetical protein
MSSIAYNGLRLAFGQSIEELEQKQAISLGCQSVEPGEDLGANQYSVWVEPQTIEGVTFDMPAINLGPSRRTRRGGLWCDGWILSFTTESDRPAEGLGVGRLWSIRAFRDEFNTAAR